MASKATARGAKAKDLTLKTKTKAKNVGLKAKAIFSQLSPSVLEAL
jgi:hypothetical protein